MIETSLNLDQDDGIEPACALLVTLRALRVYIWAGVLYGNILFRFMEYSFGRISVPLPQFIFMLAEYAFQVHGIFLLTLSDVLLYKTIGIYIIFLHICNITFSFSFSIRIPIRL